jgi:hypothetical protein
MQTFLPYEKFSESAKVLDMRRLGKQRVECLQLLNALINGGAWSKHPAAKMWKNYEFCLISYGLEICTEWIKRGYKDTCYSKILKCGDLLKYKSSPIPPWLGDDRLHSSHRSNLLRKNKEYYSRFQWIEPDNLPYYWPIGF